MTAPVATSSFGFSFAWRSHDICCCRFACSFAILIIHLMFFILLILLKLCECVCGSTFFRFLCTRHKTTLYFSPLFPPYLSCFSRQQRAEDFLLSSVCLLCLFASLVGQKKRKGNFYSRINDGLTSNARIFVGGKM